MDAPTTIATTLLYFSLAWTLFLVYDVRRHPVPVSFLCSVGLLCHNNPAMFLLWTAKIAHSAQDTALVWFVALLIFRYWRIIVNVYFFFQYKVALATADFKITPKDCTVIVPTLSPKKNQVFHEMITGMIVNRPARVIFTTSTCSAERDVNAVLKATLANIEAGTSTYQKQHGLGPMKITSEILVFNADVADKRK